MGEQATGSDRENDEIDLGDGDALEKKIRDFTDNFGSTPDVWLNIYEIMTDGKKNFLETMTIDDVTPTQVLNKISTQFGPGRYELNGRRNNENGREVLVFRETVQVGRSSKGFKPPAAEKERGNGADDSGIIQALQQNKQLLQRLLEKDSAPAAAPVNVFDLMKDFAEIKKLFEPPPAAGNMLEMVKDVLALKDQLIGSEEPRDALSMAMEKFLPVISDAVGKMQDHDQAGAHRGLARPVGDAPVSVPHPMLKMLEQFLPTAIMAANMRVEPEKAAGIVIGQIATNLPLRHALADYLDDDLALEKLASINAGVLQRRDWFNEFIDHLVLVLIPDDPRAMAQAQTDFQQHLDETAHENKDLEKGGLDPGDERAGDDAESGEIGSEGAADDATRPGDSAPGDDP